MADREQQQDDGKRASLIEAAAELFIHKGFASSGIREIASKAGCNISMIKYYFGSKEGLLQEIVKPRAENLWSSLEKFAHDDMDPVDRLNSLIDEMVRIFGRNRVMIGIVAREMIFSQSKMLPIFLPLLGRNAGRLIAVVKRALDDAGVTGVKPQAVALVIISSFIYAVVAEPIIRKILVERDGLVDSEHVDIFVEFVGPTLKAMLAGLTVESQK
jgi:AcrR family transcriptional regulator